MIKKLGTIDCDIVETTPFVWRGKLYRFEYIRKRYYANDTGDSYFRIVDTVSGQHGKPFGKGYHFGSAWAESDCVYVFGVAQWGGHEIRTFRSYDLINWESYVNIHLPGFEIFNTSVTRNGDGEYIMLFETGGSSAGKVPFTPRFLESRDLWNWRLLSEEYIFGADIYTGGHFLIWESGWYYMTYLHCMGGTPVSYMTKIIRSKDLQSWQQSTRGCFMTFCEKDRILYNSDLPMLQQSRLSLAENCNCSDHEFCEFEGRTVIFYSWGNQLGKEFLAQAIYQGSMRNLMESFF